MNANQGAGKVIEKNKLIMTGCFQTACANRHANGRDWWLLIGDNKVDTFYRFLVTPDSLLGPWVQAIENPSIDSFYFCGWANFSPDGSKFVINGCRSGVSVYDFDRCTGLLSNLRFAPRLEWEYTWGAAFSPNSRFLYVDTEDSRHLDQFDLLAPDLSASQTTVAVWDGYLTPWQGGTVFGPSCLGPDGKIYIGTHGYAHIIEHPNLPGTSCNVIQRSIESPAAGQLFTPNYPNYRLGPLDDSSCDTLGLDNLPSALFRYEPVDTTDPLTLQFTDLSWYEPDTWYWTFGDGAISQDTNPAHTFPWPGIYTVC
ncbi:MAG: PKD domain-containing protein, partial [Saprospiraceae bacterium]|nr:PKD domain-containing protein [Saprospiraceae bacterium]